jgi:nucleoid DNA-binding protein
MNKVNLIQALKDSNHLSKTEAETVINLFFNKMAAALAPYVPHPKITIFYYFLFMLKQTVGTV